VKGAGAGGKSSFEREGAEEGGGTSKRGSLFWGSKSVSNRTGTGEKVTGRGFFRSEPFVVGEGNGGGRARAARQKKGGGGSRNGRKQRGRRCGDAPTRLGVREGNEISTKTNPDIQDANFLDSREFEQRTQGVLISASAGNFGRGGERLKGDIEEKRTS